ncbi:MAG: hypothetical protein GQ559_04820 [Desulfobulbaceae bacterium]|nr:hypothetical protein [Desulfobulbaceae bacterium]
MQDKAIIQVKVVEHNHNGKVAYGTAYRINNTHAITALHVVENYESITFIFNDGSETSDFKPDYKNKDYDIALITFPDKDILNALHGIPTTEINKAEVHDEWDGAGYPRYAEEGNCREREELKGTCYHCPEDKNFFDIDCDKQPKLKKWGGVSGAPVFVKNKLVAVICQFDKALENTHFGASAIWKLLTDEKFLQYYVESSSSVYKEKLSELLTTYKDLKEEIIENLSASKETVLDAILKQEKHAVMDMCLSLQERSRKLEGINELLLYSMAYQYENNDCFSQQVTDAKPYIDVPVVRVEACEFLMASADQRKPLFKKKRGTSGQQEVIPGKYSIVAPPEYGIESRAHEDIMDNLLAGHGDYESVVERVFGDYRRASGRQYNKQMKEKVVLAMLEKSEGTYYWLLEVSGENHSELKNVFNSLPIKILNMAKDPDVEIDMAEESLFSKLGNFIKD